MKTKFHLLAGALMLSVSMLPAHAEDSGSNVMFIFDSSGSMKKQIDGGESRAEAAKRAMVAALSSMPQDSSLGLMMYGHRRAKDCSDIEIVSPIGTADGAAISQSILGSQPKGETPIAAALEQAAKSFAPMAGQSNSIVLVTDGIEECSGDPCAAARAIRDSGLGLKAHVVGFTLNEKQRQTVQCIADETGGKYFDAQNSDGLTDALAEVQIAVAQTPAEPARERVFFDDFDSADLADGADLAEHWVVNNPNPDGYIVENGKLKIVNSTVGGFEKADGANLFQLERELPEGDWNIHVNFTGNFKSLRDELEIGLRTDDKNFMAVRLFSSTFFSSVYEGKGSAAGFGGNDGPSTSDNWKFLRLNLVKISNGNSTGVRAEVGLGVALQQAKYEGFIVKGKLTLSKSGRSYSGSFSPDGEVGVDGKAVVYQTPTITSLRSPGKFTMTSQQWWDVSGEVEVDIESVEIETVKSAP